MTWLSKGGTLGQLRGAFAQIRGAERRGAAGVLMEGVLCSFWNSCCKPGHTTGAQLGCPEGSCVSARPAGQKHDPTVEAPSDETSPAGHAIGCDEPPGQ